MSRIRTRFEALAAAGRTALIPYITAGDPDADSTVALLHGLVGAGADILELGVPFSDPMADGPVIQAACERALAGGTSLRDVLEMVRAFRRDDTDTPIVLMGYLNPLESMGIEPFASAAAEAGVDGILAVDLGADEAGDVAPLFTAAGLDTVCLVAPTTIESRLARVAEHASGFLYYVSLKGVTGAASLDVAALDDRLAMIRRHANQPLAVGFGISTPEAAAAVARVADGVVVGSALVGQIGEIGADRDRLCTEVPATLAAMRRAMDETTAAAGASA
ncbi:tryptophan synthase subunit alpha [Salinisphaera sp. P385]|uniref:Tryptophan synthase alpha chain n=1 Tax=Spectribacter acetivorans TaxID=3075603 RepID=A0ABU3B3B0_9GAMM|nr:tryptophan synthase subunit alpha [Salinisphaera sp. P385]MDT0616947.1 tryptophan synthase subunit alpha [Salinisphaera sp. P385]